MPSDEGQNEKFKAKNWKKRETKKMDSVEKSKYLAYEEPEKEVTEAQAATKKRLLEEKKRRELKSLPPPAEEQDDKRKHELLIGQLKAAEARNRLRIMRLRYQANRAQEINHLIGCQPTALNSVRLQALLPSEPEKRSKSDLLDKLERDRCESLLEDERGLLVNRT